MNDTKNLEAASETSPEADSRYICSVQWRVRCLSDDVGWMESMIG